MTPEFSQAVDPVFLRVLGLLERINRSEEPVAEDERAAIRSYLDQAEAKLGQREDWQLAKYALVYWVDELLIEAPWKGHGWWKMNALEWEEYKTNDRAEDFFRKAKQAGTSPRRDALEVFYVCAVLGFRGLYADPVVAPASAEQIGIPPDLETWAQRTASAIHLGQGRRRIEEESRPIEVARPLEGPVMLIWSLFFGLILTIVTLGMFALQMLGS